MKAKRNSRFLKVFKREKTFFEKILGAGTLDDEILSVPKKPQKKVSVFQAVNKQSSGNKKSFLFKEFLFNYKKGEFFF